MPSVSHREDILDFPAHHQKQVLARTYSFSGIPAVVEITPCGNWPGQVSIVELTNFGFPFPREWQNSNSDGQATLK